MFGAIHAENAWVTARVQEILRRSGITISQLVSGSQHDRPFPQFGEALQKNGASLRPVFISAYDELWIFLPSGGQEPLVILPGEFVANSELTSLVK